MYSFITKHVKCEEQNMSRVFIPYDYFNHETQLELLRLNFYSTKEFYLSLIADQNLFFEDMCDEHFEQVKQEAQNITTVNIGERTCPNDPIQAKIYNIKYIKKCLEHCFSTVVTTDKFKSKTYAQQTRIISNLIQRVANALELVNKDLEHHIQKTYPIETTKKQ